MEFRLEFCVSFCSLFVLCLVLPGSWTHADYYRYLLSGDDGWPTKGGQESLRLKRYVDEAIPRLADNYHDKSYSLGDKGNGLGGESFLENRHLRRMEMIGNLAVPADPEPPPPEHKISSLDHSTTESPAKKTATKKKPVDLPKKSDEAFQQKLEKSMATTAEPEHKWGEDFSDFPDDFAQGISNDTLLKQGIISKQEDHHIYYNSTYISDNNATKTYWVEMEKEKNTVVSEFLSQNHRRAIVVKLSFEFPFYGHIVRNVTITTGGFLYVGDHIHVWLASTQYIAPLMANFDTSLSNSSHIKYRDDGKSFTVQWTNVSLHDQVSSGQFTFQVTLQKTGDIYFVYRHVPIPVEDINNREHPVKVGVSDAYILDTHNYVTRKKTIYEYHRVEFTKRKFIGNWTMIILNALPTCLSLMDCHSCLTEKINFDCKWCPSVGRCSTGLDRERQGWETKKCDEHYITEADHCSTGGTTARPQGAQPAARPVSAPRASNSNNKGEEVHSYRESGGHTVGMVGGIFTVVILSGVALWIFYAYRNPHTPSGQVLIKYRPRMWTLRRGEARYIPAAIHM